MSLETRSFMGKKKATDEQVVKAYEETGSVWKAAEILGMCGQSVHDRLKKLGVDTSMNVFTEEDEQKLRDMYLMYRDAGKLDELADMMGRTKHFLCRKARALGLTDPCHKKDYLNKWSHVSDEFIRDMLAEYVSSGMGLTEFCESKGIDDLGFSREAYDRFPGEYESAVEYSMSSNTKYRRGRDFEYSVRDKLAEIGYVTFRSPASKGPADVVAICKHGVYFIQCKIGGYIPVAEWNEIIDFSEKAGAVPILARRKSNGRGMEFYRLTDRKDGSKRAQPMEPFEFEPISSRRD